METPEEIAAKAAEKEAADKLEADKKEQERLAAENQEEKSLFEILNETKSSTAAAQFEEKLSPETQAKLSKVDDLIAENAALKAELENPLYQSLKIGGPDKLREVAKELAGVDYSNYSYEQLVRMNFEKSGLKGELLEQAVADKLTEYTDPDIKPYTKVLMENDLKSKFPSSGGESQTFKQLKETWAANQPKQPTKEEYEAIQQQDLALLEQAVKEYNSKGVQMSFDQIKSCYSYQNIQPYLDKDGNLDAKGMAYDKYVKENLSEIIKSERAAERIKVLKEKAGLDRTGDTGVPTSGNVDKDRESRKGLGVNENLIGMKPSIDDTEVKFN